MNPSVLKVSGTKASLDKLRNSLLAEAEAGQLALSDVVADSTPIPSGATRVRQIDLAEAIFVFAIEVPAGVTAHLVYDWVRGWLKSRADAAQIRVQEIPAEVPDRKDQVG